jgi:hypothetical protein
VITGSAVVRPLPTTGLKIALLGVLELVACVSFSDVTVSSSVDVTVVVGCEETFGQILDDDEDSNVLPVLVVKIMMVSSPDVDMVSGSFRDSVLSAVIWSGVDSGSTIDPWCEVTDVPENQLLVEPVILWDAVTWTISVDTPVSVIPDMMVPKIVEVVTVSTELEWGLDGSVKTWLDTLDKAVGELWFWQLVSSQLIPLVVGVI